MLAYLVAERTKDIGIHIALGARLTRITGSVVADGLVLVALVLQIIGRYAWYDTTRARTELGWTSRPLRETVEDTVRWLREQPSER